MAFWQRKLVKGRSYLYVYTRKDGKQCVVPRRHYKHLDGAEDHNVQAWVAQWAVQNEQGPVTPDHILFSDDSLNKRLAEWEAYFRDQLERDPRTSSKYRSLLRRYAFPYFLELGLKDPAQWPGVAPQLFDYLQKYDCSQVLIAEINNALRRFFTWLQEEGWVAWEGTLRLRNTRRGSKTTPLDRVIEPQDALAFARAQTDWRIAFMTLTGYFFSLRPQEVFALAPEDFAAGKDIAETEAAKAMREAGLSDQLAVDVRRQQSSHKGTIKPPKAYSRGWVVCFDREAATLLVGLLDGLPDGKILGNDNRKIYRLWEAASSETELDGITLKDLRRASLYWLGHHSKLKSEQVMKHARHRELSTTELYMRRPDEDKPQGRRKLKLGA